MGLHRAARSRRRESLAQTTLRAEQAGATPVEAQKAAGHTSLGVTMLYTQTEAQREREHVTKIIERLAPT
jgi:hypothetical protein